jgi:hypothetical protein
MEKIALFLGLAGSSVSRLSQFEKVDYDVLAAEAAREFYSPWSITARRNQQDNTPPQSPPFRLPRHNLTALCLPLNPNNLPQLPNNEPPPPP